MNYKYLTLPIFLLTALLFTFTQAATVNIQNKCNYTVWAAAVPGGGQRLDPGQNWTVNATTGPARIWARTGCNFDGAGRGKCQTGDCNGLLQCRSYGLPPNTIAEFAFNQFDGSDFFDTSLVDGFNIPLILSPSSGGCNRSTGCTADINRDCPNELRAPGGCNNPCTVFKTNEYCCFSGPCRPTNYSKFFKDRCPESYNYPSNDQTSTLRCPSGTNYKVAFCP